MRLAFACGLGALIGFEREIRDREAGRRFLQFPIEEVEHVTLAQLEAAAA